MKIKKGKKAFTLIELLAVIIILSIISLIVGVVIGNIIEKARKEAYKESVRGMIRAGENYIGEYPLKHGKPLRYPTEFICDGNTCSNEEDVLTFTGEVPKSGRIVISSAKLVKASYISNDRYCVTGPKENLQVAKSCADIDDTIPRIAGVQEGNVLHLTLVDNESGVDSYCVNTVNNSASCNWVSTTNSSVDHELSLSGTYYAFARDKKNNISESIEFVTGDIEKPIVTATIDGKVISISLSDNASVANWCIVNTNSYAECNWQIPESNTFSHVLSEAGTYYIFAKDTAGNVSSSVEVIAPTTAFCAFEIGHEWDFAYTGGIQEFEVPCQGLYQLEVWGSKGNTVNRYGWTGYGGSGGYSIGYKVIHTGDVLNVVCGGIPYNGGGNPNHEDISYGGGATHIALKADGYTTLASYGDAASALDYVYIVAGGGGSGSCYGDNAVGGSSGGGTNGGNVSRYGKTWTGGSQSSGGVAGGGGSGGAFGRGGVAGGGGFYGGAGGAEAGGAGGSGWIGGVPEIEYNGTTYTPSTSNGGNSDTGKAKITLISY